MNEYIGWLDDDWNTVLDQSQHIVRCRDCKHYIYGECMAEDGNGDYLRLTVPPSHFCAWGEKAVQ